MTYDQWKTASPDDEFLDSKPNEEEDMANDLTEQSSDNIPAWLKDVPRTCKVWQH